MCGRDLGGIWVDGPKKSKTYIPVKCNSRHVLGTSPEDCYYVDNKTGAAIFFGPHTTTTVDQRGCIVNIR